MWLPDMGQGQNEELKNIEGCISKPQKKKGVFCDGRN